MRVEILEGIKRHIHPLGGFENAQLIETSPGHAKVAIEITEEALNLYGNVHGGFLFTLCDMVAGMATYAYEISNVTLQGNINFVKGLNTGTIYAEANAVHKGGKTVVNQVTIHDENGTLLTSATFTMFLFEPIP